MKKIKIKQQDYENMSIDQLEYLLMIRGDNKTKVYDKIRQLNRQWNKTLTSDACQHCGYNKHVELAHLKGINAFDKYTLLKEINHPDNILVLCRNCHWEYDSGMLELIEIGLRKQ